MKIMNCQITIKLLILMGRLSPFKAISMDTQM